MAGFVSEVREEGDSATRNAQGDDDERGDVRVGPKANRAGEQRTAEDEEVLSSPPI